MSRVHTDVQLDDTVFDPLQNLQTLEVYDSCNLVHSIINSTRMLHGLRKVQELNIMHNRIMRLRSDFPSFFPFLKIIKLSGNSWHCDDNIKWLSNWIKQSNVQFYSSYNIRCASPQNILFKPLMMLTDSDFETTTTEVLTTVYSTTVDILSSTFLTSSIDKPDNNFQADTTTLDTTVVPYTSPKNSVVSITTKNTSEYDFVPTHPYEYSIITEDKKDAKIQSFSTSTNKTPETQTHNSLNTAQKPWTTNSHLNSQYLTSQDSYTTKVPPSESSTWKAIKMENNITDNNTQNFSNPQTMSPQRRVLSSRLRVAPQTSDGTGWDQTTTIVVSGTLSGACVLFVIIALTAFTCFRLRHRYQPVKHRNMRRSSSISYYPQKDEVSIVTLTEGTVGLRTTSYHGLGNKLYYIMENGGNTPDTSTDALPDSQLQELLPQSSHDSAHVY